MPHEYIVKMAKKKGMSEDDAEYYWMKAKSIAKEQGHKDEYDYITGIFKKMVNETKINSFKDYLNESSEPNMLMLDAIDMLSLANTRITDSRITSKIEKIINELSSIQRKVK